jgi:hypothetical protein
MNSGLSPLQHSRQLLRQGPVQASHGKSTATSNPSALTARTLSTQPCQPRGRTQLPDLLPRSIHLNGRKSLPFPPLRLRNHLMKRAIPANPGIHP